MELYTYSLFPIIPTMCIGNILNKKLASKNKNTYSKIKLIRNLKHTHTQREGECGCRAAWRARVNAKRSVSIMESTLLPIPTHSSANPLVLPSVRNRSQPQPRNILHFRIKVFGRLTAGPASARRARPIYTS